MLGEREKAVFLPLDDEDEQQAGALAAIETGLSQSSTPSLAQPSDPRCPLEPLLRQSISAHVSGTFKKRSTQLESENWFIRVSLGTT
jgi:hypothetical protein